MIPHSLEELKQLALNPEITDSQSKINYLAKAFELFTKETSLLENKLESVCSKLNEKVEELSVVSHYFNSLLSHISQGIIFMDGNGVVTTFNLAAENLLKIPQDSILFRPFWEIFKDDFFGFSIKDTLLARSAPQNSSLSIQKTDGLLQHLTIHPTFVQQQGAIPGLIILVQDVTKERHLEAIAQRSDRLKELGTMAAQVAHEIRNPLGGIKGFAALLERDLKDDPEKKKLASYITKGAETLNLLVSQILSYTRPAEPKKERNDLSFLFLELKDHVLMDEQLSSGITLSLEGVESPHFASFDYSLVKSALLNLVVNAIQAMPEGGTVTLAIKEIPSFFLLLVTDTGVGISPENVEKIFSPFFTTKAKGNGLGLSEVYKIIQAHGGDITVSSIQGKKTEFVIKLPTE